jgi:hypothetical protein
MAKEYLTFVRKFSDLNEGERELFIKDLTPGPRKYDTKLVRAIIARSPESLGVDADLLWVRSETGVLDPKPWGIKILEELPPYVSGRPWSDIFEVMKKKVS